MFLRVVKLFVLVTCVLKFSDKKFEVFKFLFELSFIVNFCGFYK